jgi:hypothetical protein
MAPERDTASSWKKRGYNTREAAEYIGRSAAWLRQKRLRGRDDPGDPGPRYLTTTSGASTIYLRQDLDAWLDALVGRQEQPQSPRADQKNRVERSRPREAT